jgi:hypothetical protein
MIKVAYSKTVIADLQLNIIWNYLSSLGLNIPVEGSMEKLSEGWKLSFCLELVWKIFQ